MLVRDELSTLNPPSLFSCRYRFDVRVYKEPFFAPTTGAPLDRQITVTRYLEVRGQKLCTGGADCAYERASEPSSECLLR